MPRSPSFCGVILAAGASTRMGRDKALLPWRSDTFLGSAVRTLTPLTDMVIVVAGANAANLRTVTDAAAAFLVLNPQPKRGQFSSLQVGVQEVLNRGRDAAIITLVDRPAPEVATVRSLQQTYLSSDRDVWAVVPDFQGRHGHPYVAGREMLEAFLRAHTESTARDIEHSHQRHIRYVEVADPLVVWNVDTPEDYQRILNG